MQNLKDTFYITLRDRLALLNPQRTTQVRGAIRPAVIARENELEFDESNVVDTFVLTWKAESVDVSEPLSLHAHMCEIRYRTRGTPELNGMDRGRVLSTLDAELRGILLPAQAVERDFSGDATIALQTSVFWAQPVLQAATVDGDALQRVATIEVFALQEAGER